MFSPPKKVLFVCTHNAVRSQMAEAILNHLYGDRYTAYSAGSDPTQTDPLVARVMKEMGIDVDHQWSKSLDVFKNENIDYVVTVCNQAKEACPYFPGNHINIHHGFRDPSDLNGKPEDIIHAYRQVSDEIKKWIVMQFGQIY